MSASEPRTTNIVLVEDDEVDILNVRRAFARAGIGDRLWVAHDGLAALALLRSGQVPSQRRVVLLDINMPRMNGLELLAELRADPDLHTTPVVVLSTSDAPRDRAAAYRLHVAGYLIKPVTFPEFVELMTTLSRYWSTVELP